MKYKRIDEALMALESDPHNPAYASSGFDVSDEGFGRIRVGWSILAGKIVEANMRGGFLSAIIYGKQGAGKSVYSIKVAYDALTRMGYQVRIRDIYRKYMIFSADEFIEKAQRASFKNRIPLLIWDDAGVHGGSYLFFTDQLLAKAIADSFRVIRTRVAAIIFTTPSPRDLLKPLRSYDSVIVYVHELNDEWSRAHGYQVRLLPSGDVRIQKVFMEDFKRWIPNYEDYVRYRDTFADYALEQLRQLLAVKRMERFLKAESLRERYLRKVEGQKREVSLDDIEVELVGYDGDPGEPEGNEEV